jgi:hypothetical protein
MELTSPSFHTGCLARRNDLTIRPIPELQLCMVYRPKPARIVTLNLAAWLLLEMCDGSIASDIFSRYAQALENRGKHLQRKEAEDGLRSLIKRELITISPSQGQQGSGT